jgi:hypothetical protein
MWFSPLSDACFYSPKGCDLWRSHRFLNIYVLPACLPLDQNKQLMPLCRAIEFSRQGEDEEISRRELTVGSQSRNRRRVYLQLLFFNYFCLCVVREYQKSACACCFCAVVKYEISFVCWAHPRHYYYKAQTNLYMLISTLGCCFFFWQISFCNQRSDLMCTFINNAS